MKRDDKAPARGKPRFVPGMELSHALFDEVIQPALTRTMPGLRYAAGLFGVGSEALGYDTARSMDYDWGPRCVLMLDKEDELVFGDRTREAIADAMPPVFRGFPALFQDASDEPGVVVPADLARDAPTWHLVDVTTMDALHARVDYAPGDEADPVF